MTYPASFAGLVRWLVVISVVPPVVSSVVLSVVLSGQPGDAQLSGNDVGIGFAGFVQLSTFRPRPPCYLSRLHRDLIALRDDAVVLVHVDELRVIFLQFDFVIHGIAGDDDDVARAGLMRRRAIHGNHAGTALRADSVSGETFTIGDIVNIDLLIFPDIGSIEQIVVDRAGALVMQLGVRDMHSVQLGFKHDSLHGTPLISVGADYTASCRPSNQSTSNQSTRQTSILSSKRVLPKLAAPKITRSRCDWLAGSKSDRLRTAT